MVTLSQKREKILRIGVLFSPIIIVSLVVIVFRAERREAHRLAVARGETHVSNCFLKRLRGGDFSPETERLARAELAALQRHKDSLDRRLARLDAITDTARKAGRDPASELKAEITPIGTVSCKPGDYESDAEFTAENK